ncbi:ADP-forming succinate--CoA ligase subunit beta [Anaeromyxobacter sp. Fw109-5]|uniref:ADP-forming succinate--CoA ligase subunit beta n=1 Tax=Anaeromyxobacter sp. (strain Fw109-5) TaxID=404589 RepID=UPI0000ED75B2|nr:ADP-forming succinate--CoA ligase subunit beta [Anaeromyxobacter sp. Fw109-5]ABS26386.1 succinyl-CoA synthetase, beta subunit [Anaeromyxobacter sp. Fw109-5]
MKIHEYQAKDILRRFGVAVPRGYLAVTPLEAEGAARQLGGGICAVKAQIHAGGRGKGGGVRLARSPDEARQHAEAMLGMMLKTPQTGPEGQEVRKVYIEEGCRIARELYLGMTLDREAGRLAVMASIEGGVDIEEVAKRHPEKILREWIDPLIGLMPYQARRLAFGLGLTGDSVGAFVRFATGLHNAYVATDASLAEINPLVITVGGEVLALDAKMNFDDNALYRHADIAAMRDPDEEDPKETTAKEYDLSYIALDGDIGCMVNGAGLAMATMDVIKLSGGRPANFLDVGGGADEDKVTAALKIILSDPAVRAVLVNIFGGIMKCDVIANGIVAAARQVGLALPLVVRLEGTNVELGKEILAHSELDIIPADDLGDAARKVVAAARA